MTYIGKTKHTSKRGLLVVSETPSSPRSSGFGQWFHSDFNRSLWARHFACIEEEQTSFASCAHIEKYQVLTSTLLTSCCHDCQDCSLTFVEAFNTMYLDAQFSFPLFFVCFFPWFENFKSRLSGRQRFLKFNLFQVAVKFLSRKPLKSFSLRKKNCCSV